MNLWFGRDVRDDAGDKLGELQGVVYNPESQQVLALVVQRVGFDQPDYLVTLRAVDTVDPDGEEVYLNVTPEEFDRMRPLSEDEENIAPPPDAGNVTDDLVKEPVDVPDVPPVGAATGVESIAYTPIIKEMSNLRPGDIVINRTTEVSARDGIAGHICRIFVDDMSHEITGLIAKRGPILFEHEVGVPLERVRHFSTEAIDVDTNKNELQPWTVE